MPPRELPGNDKPFFASSTTPSTSFKDDFNSLSSSRGVWGLSQSAQSVNLGVSQPVTNGISGNGNGKGAIEPWPVPVASVSASSSASASTTQPGQKSLSWASTHTPANFLDNTKRTSSSSYALPGSNGRDAGGQASTNYAPSPLPQNHLRGGVESRNASPATQVQPQPVESGLFRGLHSLNNGTSDTAGNSGGRSEPVPSNATNPAVVNKPVLKMRRTGQNFPLNSATASHQRNGSSSPIRRPGVLPAGSLVGKSPDLIPSKVAAATSTIRETPVPVPKLPPPSTRRQGPKLASTIPAEKVSLPISVASSRSSGSAANTTFTTILDSDSDDIIYETAGQTGDMDAAGMTVDAENVSSSDESDSQSDEDDENDEAIETDADGDVDRRQLFQAPDQETEYDEAEDESDDDNASSASSSADSSMLDQPSVALPSAKIQHHEAYPSTVLNMAEPGRLYTEYHDKSTVIKAGPALFPVGYRRSDTVQGFPWLCAVRSCRLLYKTPAGLANHARFTHKRTMLNDNMDGTVSLVGSYSNKNSDGFSPPVVVSRRPLDPREPPMPEPSIPRSKTIANAGSSVEKAHLKQDIDGDDAVMDDGEIDGMDSKEPASRPDTADQKKFDQMWEYIRPYLAVHKSAPTKNYSRQIMTLPRVRDIKWNEERNKDWPYKDSHPRDVTALIVQVTGVESPTPCASCSKGRGPFIGCVTVSPDSPDEVKAAVLSCANCYYHCGQSSCSLCKADIARRHRQPRFGGLPNNYNVKLLSDATRGKTNRVGVKQPQALSSPAVSPIETSARRKLKLYQPSEFRVIENASNERTYKVIKGSNGEDVLLCGALIPEKYDLDRTLAPYHWICPIRSCRKVFKKIEGLGSHFIKAHPGTLLNDNLDGTLSRVGYYNKPRPGVNGLPALIISKRPLDPEEPPMEMPARPGQAGQGAKHKTMIQQPPSSANSIPMVSERRVNGDAEKLLDHIAPYLPDIMKSVESDPKLLFLSNLPAQRNLEWRSSYKGRPSDDRGNILGMIIYLAGEAHMKGKTNQPWKCTHCSKGHGPFPHCVMLKKGVPQDAASLVRSCANCVWRHKSSECSIKLVAGWNALIHPAGDIVAPAANWADAAPGGTKRLRITDSESEEPLAVRRRSDRLGLEEDCLTNTEHTRNRNTLSIKHDIRSTLGDGSGSHLHMPELSTVASSSRGAFNGGFSSALIHAGQVQPDDLLEMEDWEIAPGRIRAAGGTEPSSIAFSKSYLETNKAMRVSRDVTFEVKTLKSGHNLELAADPKTRYCTLSSGKLHVNVKGEEPFVIGQHGLFKVTPGATASIQNKLYVDSVLHISTYDG